MPKTKSDNAMNIEALAQKLNSNTVSAKRKSPTKKTVSAEDLCVAAVTSTKGKAKSHLETGNDKRPVYMMTENDGKKHTFYLQCSRAHKDKSKFCGIHKKTYDDDKSRIVNYKRMIGMKNVEEIVLEDDIFTDKVSAKKKANPKKKRTVTAADVSDRLDKLEALMLGLTKAVSDTASIKSSSSVAETAEVESDDESAESEAESDDDVESKAESADDAESEAESDNDEAKAESEAESADEAKAEESGEDSGEDADEDDEIEAVEITTNDGQTFGLLENTMTVYTPDGDEMGKFVKVDDDDSCVTFKDEQYIIAKDIPYKGDTYFRCVISNKAYSMDGDGDVKICGKVVKTTKGKLKVKLST